MFKQVIKNLLLLSCMTALSACSLFEKDNTPEPKALTPLTAEIKPQLLWSTKTGSGTDEYLKLNPALTDNAVIVANTNGTVSSINKANGRVNWSVNTKETLTTGPGAGDGLVVVGGQNGAVIALQEQTGNTAWRTNVSGELLANPAVAHGKVVVKATDGYVRAYATQDGRKLWSFQQTEPTLILRGSSSPVIYGNEVLTGFANGNLNKLGLNDGRLIWVQTVAVPQGAFNIQRMIDIDANPIMFGQHVYTATYQGNIASIDWISGRTLWSHDISSYTGLAADSSTVYVSDAKGFVWAFSSDNGLVNWRQVNLEARIISGPASMGRYLVVGDAEGFLHWMSKQDGHFAARMYTGGAIYAAPIAEHNVLYALSSNGLLSAFEVSQ
jgi:outer membrane protein assembly factor BamB